MIGTFVFTFMQSLICVHYLRLEKMFVYLFRYQIGKILGRGSFGEVRECGLRDNSESYAVKIVEIEADESYWSSRSIFKREVSFLRGLGMFLEFL